MYEYIYMGSFEVKYSGSFKIYADSSVVFKSSLSLNHWRNIVRNVTPIVVWTHLRFFMHKTKEYNGMDILDSIFSDQRQKDVMN
jgi:hypothetical protein